jgi:hypothetical protein
LYFFQQTAGFTLEKKNGRGAMAVEQGDDEEFPIDLPDWHIPKGVQALLWSMQESDENFQHDKNIKSGLRARCKASRG